MIRTVLSILLFFVSTSASMADDSALSNYPHDLQSILDNVVAHHPFLTASAEEIKGARGELLSNQGAFDPVLKSELSAYPKADYSGTYSSVFAEQPLEWMGSKLIAGYRKGSGTFPIYENIYETNDEGEARLGFEMPILRDRPIDRRRASIQRATMQIEGANFTLNQRKIELVRNASLAFWEWIAAKQKFSAFQDLLNVAERRDRQLVERVSVGDLSEFDRKDNLRQVLQRKAFFVAAERSIKKAEYELGLFLWTKAGSPDQGLLQPSLGNLPEPPSIPEAQAEFLETETIRARPDILRLNNQLEQQEIEKTLAENQILPRLDLRVYGSKDYGEGSDSRDEAELKVGINIEIPLETRTQQGRLSVIAARTRELIQHKILAEQRVRIEIADSKNSFHLAVERMKVIRDELRLTQELQVGERSKLDQGDSNLIFLNLREQATTDAKVREIDAVADAWKAYALYKAALGKY